MRTICGLNELVIGSDIPLELAGACPGEVSNSPLHGALLVDGPKDSFGQSLLAEALPSGNPSSWVLVGYSSWLSCQIILKAGG